MITKIFYSLVLFPHISYDMDISSFRLQEIQEQDFGVLSLKFVDVSSRIEYVKFRYKNFLIDGTESTIENWNISGTHVSLTKDIIFKLKKAALGHDFNFFEKKEFYDNIPFGTVLTITSKCNIFCYYCFNDYDYPLKDRNLRKSIGINNYKKIVDILYKEGTRDIILTGGEPFVFEAFWELLDYIQSKGIFIRINTNGTLLSDVTLKKLNDNYSLVLMVSMHEFNNKDYFKVNEKGAQIIQGLTGVKNFENKFLEKVEQLKKIKNHSNITLDFLTILTSKNILFLEEIYKWGLANFSLQDWHFFRLYSTDTGPGISRSMISLAIHTLYKLNKKYKVDFKIVDSVPFCVIKDTEIASKVIDGELSENHNVKTIITTDGYIQIMSAFDSNLGSIFENSLRDVWGGEFVQKMLNNGFLPKECEDCKYKDTCRGGSRMDAHIYNGSYDAFDPLGNLNNKVVI